MSLNTTLRLLEEDNGNCRVYYKRGKHLFCWQLDRPGQFSFFVCSRDGEPSYEVTADIWCPLPIGETSIGRELRQFLEMQRAIVAMTTPGDQVP